MTNKEAIQWLVPPGMLSNGDEDDPVQKHWIAYQKAISLFKALDNIENKIQDAKVGCDQSVIDGLSYAFDIIQHEQLRAEWLCSIQKEIYDDTDNKISKIKERIEKRSWLPEGYDYKVVELDDILAIFDEISANADKQEEL